MKYKLQGYHPETKQRVFVADFPTERDARVAMDALETIQQTIVEDSPMKCDDGGPWRFEIIDHLNKEVNP